MSPVKLLLHINSIICLFSSIYSCLFLLNKMFCNKYSIFICKYELSVCYSVTLKDTVDYRCWVAIENGNCVELLWNLINFKHSIILLIVKEIICNYGNSMTKSTEKIYTWYGGSIYSRKVKVTHIKEFLVNNK